MLLDIHTHRLPEEAATAILSCHMYSLPPAAACFLSAGIHPWFLSQEDLPAQKEWLRQILEDKRVIALGEAGIDKRCKTPLELQKEAFRYVCRLSEQHRLPLIIHAVKATPELMAFRKEIRPQQPWIIHGFRGNKEVAQSLIRHGFYLSFGEKYQEEALAVTPPERLLLETDESPVPAAQLCRHMADVLQTSVPALTAQLQQTIKSLFFNP